MKRVFWFASKKNMQIGQFSGRTPKVYMLTDKYRLGLAIFVQSEVIVELSLT